MHANIFHVLSPMLFLLHISCSTEIPEKRRSKLKLNEIKLLQKKNVRVSYTRYKNLGSLVLARDVPS